MRHWHPRETAQKDVCEVGGKDEIHQISKINLLKGRIYTEVAPPHSGPQVC